jgi:energy-coupling factor transport system ATP-binding protein
MALVEIESLSFTYPQASAPALVDVSLSLGRGEFAVLCGRSGCGKTTLLRHLKTSLAPAGTQSGAVRFSGELLGEISLYEQARAIGFVLQSPDNQIVTDKVWHELAFGLESLGTPQQVIRLRVAEMASFFGIQEWYHRRVAELSGGQKQLLNLAAVMALQPRLLVLDEPTSQLDPIAASEFLAAVRRVNGELGVTVLLSEHRLEEALPLCDRTLVMTGGRLVADARPAEAARLLFEAGDPMLVALPTPMRVALSISGAEGVRMADGGAEGVRTADGGVEGGGWVPDAGGVGIAGDDAGAGGDPGVPVSVREGRSWLEKRYGYESGDPIPSPSSCAEELGIRSDEGSNAQPGEELNAPSDEPLISARDVWFRYAKDGVDVLRGMALAVYSREMLAIVGGNGTGKTTALGVLSGALKPYRGRIRVAGLDPAKAGIDRLTASGLTVLPQDPQTLFLHSSIIENLADALPRHITEERRNERLAWVIEATEIADIATRHPYDVSGGEQQRAALAIALLTEPSILFMDEPTKGMDAFYKKKFADILNRLRADGLTVVMVSHDVEFCAAHATRCALFFDGGVITEGSPRRFFSGNSFYTTAANRMSRGLLPDMVTTEDLIDALAALPTCGESGDRGDRGDRGGVV